MEDRVFVNKCENVADEFFASLDRLEITKIPGENGNGVEFGKEPFSTPRS